MQHEQFSMFDLFTPPQEAPAPVPADAQPVPVSIQASMKGADGSGYVVFGVARANIVPSAWRPTAREVLEMFPLSLSWHIGRDALDRDGVVDLFAHEIDAEGNMVHMQADAHATVRVAELCNLAKQGPEDAAKSF